MSNRPIFVYNTESTTESEQPAVGYGTKLSIYWFHRTQNYYELL